ncbi:5-hydroxytryptamine receptor 3A-like [Sander vitreus]
MMLAGFFFFYSSSQVEIPTVTQRLDSTSQMTKDPDSCGYQDVLNYLNLTKNKDKYTMARPVKNFKKPTRVHLQIVIYGILDVVKIDQTFVAYVWIYMKWKNEYIEWFPPNFCGIEQVVVPIKLLWKPDLTIEEMTEKDKAPPSPYLTIDWDGYVTLRNDLMIVSMCRMQVYKFPFDIQSCNLSFKSATYSDDEIKFETIEDGFMNTEWTQKLMRTQYEWLFLSMTVNNKTVSNLIDNQSMIVYTIKMRRRSILYIANFLVPIMFFFCLDLASFLISDSGGEKLGFKVTVLLAVTVMQLILNDILPSSSDRIPLIAVYCIGMFGLMMLSLLETILVMHLMEKDSKDQSLSEDCGDKQGKVSFHNCCREVKKLTHVCHICDVFSGETPSGLLPVAKEGSSRHLTEESHASDELSEAVKALTLLLSNREEERIPGYCTRVAKTINKVFFIFYVIAASVFLLCLFFIW